MKDRGSMAAYTFILGLFTFFFFMRVMAQALVALFDVPFLPSMEEWVAPSSSPFSTSGLIPYPILFTLQVLILIFQIKVCIDFSRGYGRFVSLRKQTARVLLWVSYFYFTSMALRYVVTMALYPERRWLGHTIPILLHFVLAGFLFALGRYHTTRATTAKRV